ncbi:UNVERIFIED_CONTAM: hypothetical protein K2H54_022679, partial [Gekko kuhli]
VRIWEIADGGLKRNMTEAVLELYGHSRRVGLIEWHPTANNILFSAGYDYKVLIWNLEIGEPVKMIDCHSDVILCMSFNTDGSLLATSCKDKKLRVIEPRSGKVLQEANCKNHRVNRVVFLGNLKRLLTTGVSRWNTRQIALWDQEDLSMPLIEEEIDGLSGLLFPFYDADTHMLYLAGKGDGNIRYYEISTEKPYLTYLMEFRSPAPQKGLGVMPKHGLDVSACEVFRFYKLVTLKGLIEPISMIVPRRPVPEETTAEVTVQVKIEIEESEIALQLPASKQTSSDISIVSSEENKLICLLESVNEKLKYVSAAETNTDTPVEQTVTVEANSVVTEKSKEKLSDPSKENPEKLQNESFLLEVDVEAKESKVQKVLLKEDIALQKERKEIDAVVTERNVDPKKDNDFANECQLCQFDTETVTMIEQLSETYQEDIYPMTPGTEPALAPDEWLSGTNR